MNIATRRWGGVESAHGALLRQLTRGPRETLLRISSGESAQSDVTIPTKNRWSVPPPRMNSCLMAIPHVRKLASRQRSERMNPMELCCLWPVSLGRRHKLDLVRHLLLPRKGSASLADHLRLPPIGSAARSAHDPPRGRRTLDNLQLTARTYSVHAALYVAFVCGAERMPGNQYEIPSLERK